MTLFCMSYIAGTEKISEQESLSFTNKRFYEVHLKKAYSKEGRITIEELQQLAKQVYTNFDDSIFYTVSPINLPKILKDQPNFKISSYNTKISVKAALRLRSRPMPYYFYIIEVTTPHCFITSGPTVE